MNPSQVKMVQESFEKVAPIAEAAAQIFYARLFELDPSLTKLFRGDIKQQGERLMQMIATAVRGLSRPESLVPVLQSLGRRHAGYGVMDAHYDTVGKALLWTLERGLGPAFTPPVRDAWAAAYKLMSGVMMQAGHSVPMQPQTRAA